MDTAPRPPAGQPRGLVDARVQEALVLHLDDGWRETADGETVSSRCSGPQFGEAYAGESEVTRFFLAVVAVDLGEKRVGVGMLE